MHIQIIFYNTTEEIKDILIASLNEIAVGFEEEDDKLQAYFAEHDFDQSLIDDLAKSNNIQYEKNNIVPQNWNELWESNFDPVLVDDFVGIRASFHQPLKNVQHEIIITPKMSFGTGHHATTYLMMQQMRQLDFNNKSVFDFGTGTGVLAILSYKLGAADILASDIDEWSIQNSKENFEHNHCSSISIVHSDTAVMGKEFEIILANINRNVLLEHIPALSVQLKKEGQLVLSGILEEDQGIISDLCVEHQLKFDQKTSKDKWICMSFSKLPNESF